MIAVFGVASRGIYIYICLCQEGLGGVVYSVALRLHLGWLVVIQLQARLRMGQLRAQDVESTLEGAWRFMFMSDEYCCSVSGV